MNADEYLMTGQLVSLRLMEEKDFPLVVGWRNLKRVRNNFIYREEFTLEGQHEWQKTMIDTGKVVQFMICENKRDFRAVGCVYLRDIDLDKKTAEYGIFIGEDDATGLGYGNETADLATEYAKSAMGLKQLILRVFVRNVSAIKSYEHAGFEKTDFLPDVCCSDGQKDDMILMRKYL
jgi:RimJ/RimL family protein N-acetyltransferase